MNPFAPISQFLDSLGDAIVMVDRDSRIVFANRSAHRLFGYEEGGLVDRKLPDLMAQSMPGDQHERLVQNFIDKKSSPKPMMTRGSMLCRTADGRDFHARITISTVEIEQTVFGVATIQDFTPVQQSFEELETHSNTDSLTGLYNRRYFHLLCDLEAGPIHHWSSIGLIYLDLDQFKPVNDTHGHAVGDEVLKIVAQRIQQRLRNEDLAIRMGGDEFLVFLDLSGHKPRFERVRLVAEELLERIEQPMKVHGHALKISASAGCAIYPDHSNSLPELVQLVDRHMYTAKLKGGTLHMASA